MRADHRLDHGVLIRRRSAHGSATSPCASGTGCRRSHGYSASGWARRRKTDAVILQAYGSKSFIQTGRTEHRTGMKKAEPSTKRRYTEQEIESMLDGFMKKHSEVYDRLAEI